MNSTDQARPDALASAEAVGREALHCHIVGGGMAGLASAAYLIREGKKADEMYVFLPALNRTRRIMGGAGDGPLFGTDLSYADIKQLQNAFGGSAIKVLGSQKLDGRTTTMLSALPTAESNSRYAQVNAWVDDISCLPMKVEFLEGKTIRKRLEAPAHLRGR